MLEVESLIVLHVAAVLSNDWVHSVLMVHHHHRVSGLLLLFCLVYVAVFWRPLADRESAILQP